MTAAEPASRPGDAAVRSTRRRRPLVRLLVGAALSAAVGLPAVLGPGGGARAAAAAVRSGADRHALAEVAVTDRTFVVTGRPTPARQGVAASTTRTIHEVVYSPSTVRGPLPTVVFAPGWDNQSSYYGVLLQTIASSGFLVIGVDSPGTSNYFPGLPLTSDLGNNTLDLSAALADVENGPLGSEVDRSEVAAVGHSDGGSEVATLALDSQLASTEFSAYVVLSGDVPEGQVPGSFAPTNNGPVLAMVGDDDEYGNYTPEPGGDGTESVYRAAAPTRIMTVIAGADHLSAYVGSGAQADDTRAAVVAFLSAALTHSAAARAELAGLIQQDGLSSTADYGPSWALPPPAVATSARPDGTGYWVAGADGRVHAFGSAAWYGNAAQLSAPVVGMASTPDGDGYWLVTSSGAVYAFGDAVYRGGVSLLHLAAPVVGMAADGATGGYWLVAADGGVFAFGAPFEGSAGNLRLAAPVVGMAAAPDGRGYWLVGTDGGVFAYGTAPFAGSMGGVRLARPVVGMAIDTATGGYWLVAADGGVFAFHATFWGSAGALALSAPVVSMSAPASGRGYWLVAADGGVFNYGLRFLGSAA